ncbi:SDR family oxidoreductase [Halobacillus sp. KGW1]|uniref:SDR family oxidoreductase n=1 Tax=Halobacillus sp. KGW1 TaxID=1793726 RepID=UPI000783C4F0|nr:SDR family oxidoreductase [Halobacillus sp. KGW1]
MNPTVLITGASSGFGYLTAVKCAEKGFSVIATMRNMEKAEVFEDAAISNHVRSRITVWKLDVTDDASIAAFKEKLNDLEAVDVLVNNAGFAIGGFLEQIPLEAYRRQFETNVFGVIAVTQAVLPLMRKQKRGKIINVSSVSGLIGFPGLSAYVSSKHALEGLTESLRFEVQPFGIDVALVEPGSYQTNIWSAGMELPDAVHDPDSPYADYIKGLWNALNGDSRENPSDVAALMTELVEQDRIRKLRFPIGAKVKFNVFLKRVMPWRILEKAVLTTVLGKGKTNRRKRNDRSDEWGRRDKVRG